MTIQHRKETLNCATTCARCETRHRSLQGRRGQELDSHRSRQPELSSRFADSGRWRDHISSRWRRNGRDQRLGTGRRRATRAQFGSRQVSTRNWGRATGLSSREPTRSNAGRSTTPSKVRYLRKIPVDPMTGKADWGLRAVQDDPDSDSWGGHNVFDVYSQSPGDLVRRENEIFRLVAHE